MPPNVIRSLNELRTGSYIPKEQQPPCITGLSFCRLANVNASLSESKIDMPIASLEYNKFPEYCMTKFVNVDVHLNFGRKCITHKMNSYTIFNRFTDRYQLRRINYVFLLHSNKDQHLLLFL